MDIICTIVLGELQVLGLIPALGEITDTPQISIRSIPLLADHIIAAVVATGGLVHMDTIIMGISR